MSPELSRWLLACFQLAVWTAIARLCFHEQPTYYQIVTLFFVCLLVQRTQKVGS